MTLDPLEYVVKVLGVWAVVIPVKAEPEVLASGLEEVGQLLNFEKAVSVTGCTIEPKQSEHERATSAHPRFLGANPHLVRLRRRAWSI